MRAGRRQIVVESGGVVQTGEEGRLFLCFSLRAARGSEKTLSPMADVNAMRRSIVAGDQGK
jgi:hypothetical protein